MSNWFGRFQLWLQKVMYGRYGGDQLNWALLVLYLVLWLLGGLTRFVLFPLLSWAVLILVFFRKAVGGKPEISQGVEPSEGIFHQPPGRMEGQGPSVLQMPQMQKQAARAEGQGENPDYLPGMSHGVYQENIRT